MNARVHNKLVPHADRCQLQIRSVNSLNTKYFPHHLPNDHDVD